MPRSTAIPEAPVHCRACGYDVSGLPRTLGVRTCPECGRGVAHDGSNTPPPHPPEIRCGTCGHNLAGLGTIKNTVSCPTCRAELDVIAGSPLEPWPGDREVLKRMLWFNPFGLVCAAAFIGLITALRAGAVSAGVVAVGIAIGATLSTGEAVVQARKIVHATWPKQDRAEKFKRTALTGAGISLAIWANIALAAAIVLIWLL